MLRVSIIGSGVAGLAAAIRLRAAGHEVDVFESAATYGGKVKEYKWEGFRFDTGPSLFTLPEYVTELLGIDKQDSANQLFEYTNLKTITRYFYPSGIVLDSFADPVRFSETAEVTMQVPAKKVLRYLEFQKKTYKLLAPIFIEKPIHIISRLFRLKNVPALIHIMRPSFLRTMNSENARWFGSEALTMLFNRYGTYNGSNPYKMPSLFNIISHLEHNVGAYLPKKGMHAIPQALYQKALQLGVRVHFNSTVTEIITEKGRAVGLKLGGKTLAADVVISNMDVHGTYHKLLPQYTMPGRYENTEKSTSALIFHWAMSRAFQNLDVHNILFSGNYKEEFKHLFDLKTMYADPTVYLYISSKACEADAPTGCENWFVMVNTPNLGGSVHWDTAIESIKNAICTKIEQMLGIDPRPFILHEHYTTPRDLEATTHSYLGSLYGSSSNSMVSAFMRHPNFGQIRNLYFVGGTVHPGGGIPLCLLSAKITAELIAEGYNLQK